VADGGDAGDLVADVHDHAAVDVPGVVCVGDAHPAAED
jgi:hypothetical protein